MNGRRIQACWEDGVRSRAYDLFFDRKLSLPVKILLSLAVTAGALWLGTRRGFYETCVFNLFLTFGLAVLH